MGNRLPRLVFDPSPLPIRIDFEELMTLLGENKIQGTEN
jgi:hypothetical protein